jgi:transcriptional regulator with XRE-family HTH domain
MPESVSNAGLGDRVRKLREERNWSLTALAARAGISRSYLSQIESGESIPTQAKIVQLANAFGALPSEFAEAVGLGSAEVQMLARIEYRGKRPNSIPEWKAIYAVIKGILEE